MKPSLITSVYFNTEDDLSDLLDSLESSAVEIRQELVSRLKKGEGLVAVVGGALPKALVLRSKIEPKLAGTPEGEQMLPVAFG